MDKYFGIGHLGGQFKIFSIPHIAALMVILAINILIYLFRNKLSKDRIDICTRYTLAILLFVSLLSLMGWYANTGTWSLGASLPLHLCRAAGVICIIMLLTKNYRVYEIVYFWGLGGAMQALLTPNSDGYNFPHFRFIEYFILHGLVVTAILFMTFAHSYRPSLKSLFKSFKLLNVYLLFIIIVNFVTGGNYLYIARKPPSPTLMDYLGPWPWYIISLEFVGLLLFGICYLPIAAKKYFYTPSAKHAQQVK